MESPSLAELRSWVLSLRGNIGAHDPTIVQESGVYYCFATGNGIPVTSSKDLKNWTALRPVFSENPDWTAEKVPGSTSFWAPEVVFRQGRWRVYYSISTFGSQRSAIGLVSSPTLDQSSADYRWRDDGVVITSSPSDDFNAIDAAVVADEKGNDWMLWGSFWGGLKMCRIDNISGKTLPENEKIYSLANRRTEPDTVEGGFIFAKDGWFYLFCSFDFCCRKMESTYKIAVGRSRCVTGPYLDKNGNDLNQGGGTLIRDGENDPDYVAMGHNSIFFDGKEAWMVFHAYSRTRNGEPVLAIEKLIWDGEGWPLAPGQILKNTQQRTQDDENRKTAH